MGKPVRFFIGIDIGKSGAIVVQGKSGNLDTYKMPLDSKGDLDYYKVCRILGTYRGGNPRVLFEDIGSIYGVGKTSYGVLMKQAGAIEMACVALGIPHIKVKPRTWQEAMTTQSDEVWDGKKRDTKATALNAAKRLYPSARLNFGGRAKVPHDGLVDALLMSKYLMGRVKE